MPIIKSAKKRVRVAHKAAVRNSKTKRNLRSAVKKLEAKVTQESLQKAQSAIDVAAKKGLMHKNKAARKKAQLAKQAKAAGLKLTSTKKSTPKAAKPTVKKTTAKTGAKKPASKPTAKKAPAKKPASKK